MLASVAFTAALAASALGEPLLLNLRVESASGLPDAPLFASNNPFVVATVDAAPAWECETPAASGTTDPVWEHACSGALYEPVAAELTLSVLSDEVLLLPDRAIATGSVALPAAAPGGAESVVEVALSQDGEPAGMLVVAYTLINDCENPARTEAECLEPTGVDCEFYDDCVEAIIPCGPDGYAIGYGGHFCRQFSENRALFTDRGFEWVDAVRGCLQRALVPTLDTCPADLTCDELQQFAFDSHVDCYVEPAPGAPSICDPLMVVNYPSLLWTIKSSFVTELAATLEQALGVIASCGQKAVDAIKVGIVGEASDEQTDAVVAAVAESANLPVEAVVVVGSSVEVVDGESVTVLELILAGEGAEEGAAAVTAGWEQMTFAASSGVQLAFVEPCGDDGCTVAVQGPGETGDDDGNDGEGDVGSGAAVAGPVVAMAAAAAVVAWL